MSSLVGTSLLSDEDGGGGQTGGRRGARVQRSESPSSTSGVSRPRSYVVARSRAASFLNARQRSPSRLAGKDAVDRAPGTTVLGGGGGGGGGAVAEEEWMRRRKEKLRRSRITNIETAAKRLLANDPESTEAKLVSRASKVVENNPEEVNLVKLINVHLQKIGTIAQFTNLKVCILSNNYLTTIDPVIINCPQLIKIDVHSNQIRTLPDALFFARMPHLIMANLHDNAFTALDNLLKLGCASSLQILTLYDTPMSLKRHYRHHAVNTIPTLRAFDRHLVSDEEIIEDANFGKKSRFKTVGKGLRMNLCPLFELSHPSLLQELSVVSDVLAKIDAVSKHFSPVLVIQRWVRGHNARKRYGAIQELRLWACLTIQRWYRGAKGFAFSSVVRTSWSREQKRGTTPTKATKITAEYRGGIMGLRAKLATSGCYVDMSELISRTQFAYKRDLQWQKHIAKMYEDPTMPFFLPPKLPEESLSPRAKFDWIEEEEEERKMRAKQRRKVKHQREFFLDHSIPAVGEKEEWAEEDEEEEEEEEEMSPFRLLARTPPGPIMTIRGAEPLVKPEVASVALIDGIRRSGEDVRRAKEEVRDLQLKRLDVLPAISKRGPGSESQFFRKTMGAASLAPFFAIQKKFDSSARRERSRATQALVEEVRSRRERGAGRVFAVKEQKRKDVLARREQDQAELVEKMENVEMKRLRELRCVSDSRRKSEEERNAGKKGGAFVMEFISQANSVGKALRLHDTHVNREAELMRKAEKILTLREIERQNKDTVRKFNEYTALKLQARAAAERSSVDDEVIKASRDRLDSARRRVEALKMERKKTYFPFTSGVTHAQMVRAAHDILRSSTAHEDEGEAQYDDSNDGGDTGDSYALAASVGKSTLGRGGGGGGAAGGGVGGRQPRKTTMASGKILFSPAPSLVETPLANLEAPLPNESVLSTIAIVARQREVSREAAGVNRGGGFVVTTASRHDLAMTAPAGLRPGMREARGAQSIGPGTAPERGGGGRGGEAANDLEGALVISRPSNHL